MTGTPRPALVHAFRRAALPLAAYYAVTLVLPLANGAAQSGAAFVSHALVVLVVPPILIVLVWAIHRAAVVGFSIALMRDEEPVGLRARLTSCPQGTCTATPSRAD